MPVHPDDGNGRAAELAADVAWMRKVEPILIDTLGKWAAHMAVWCRCEACGHQLRLDLDALAEKLGPETRIGAYQRRARCGQCGSAKVEWTVMSRCTLTMGGYR